MERTLAELKNYYFNHYLILGASFKSIRLAKTLWNQWQSPENKAPDINEIAKNTQDYESKFVQEIVEVAEKVSNKKMNIDYCPFILNDYYFRGIRAIDGYLILTDETFFKLLFSLTNILMCGANNLIANKEMPCYSKYIKNLINGYITNEHFQKFNPETEVELIELYKRDYEVMKCSVYLFNSFKIFIFAHEIAHYVFNHPDSTNKMHFENNKKDSVLEADTKSKEYELEADELAYRIFLEILNIKDTSKKICCIYRFEFAPLLLFDIFDKMDRMKESVENIKIEYRTHPAPLERKDMLMQAFSLNNDDLLYSNLKDVLSEMSDICQ